MKRPERRTDRGRLSLSRSLLLALLFVASLPAVATRIYSADEIEYFAFLRSLWFDRDLSFDNEYRHFYDLGIARAYRFHETFLELTTPTGLRFNFGTIGSALLWAPMYGAADVGVRIARGLGSPVAADGFSHPYVAAVAIGSALYGFLALLLSISVASRVAGNGYLAAAIVWLGTPLLFYMYLAPGMSHACSAFSVAAFVACWLIVRERWSPGGLAALGALAALMTMVREQDAFYATGVILDFAWSLRDDVRSGRRAIVRERLGAALAGAATFVLCFLPQVWAYRVLNGRIGPAASVSAKMQWATPHSLQVLFSPEHGFFAWTPLALLSIWGLLALARRAATSANRRIAICMLAMFLAQVYISGSVGTWTVAGSFGQRRFVSASVLLITGLAALIHFAKGWQRPVVGLLIALSTWWNLGMMAQFGAGWMDRQSLDLARNAYNTFVVFPREAPALAWRYLFDRSSFYQAPDQAR